MGKTASARHRTKHILTASKTSLLMRNKSTHTVSNSHFALPWRLLHHVPNKLSPCVIHHNFEKLRPRFPNSFTD